MPDLTDADLERLAELAEKATPGPWKAMRRVIAHAVASPSYEMEAPFVEPIGLQIYSPDWQHDGRCDAKRKGNTFISGDAAFIAAARDAVPRLVREVRILREALGWVLPMAKGYAAEHPVGRNVEIVAHAEILSALRQHTGEG